MKRHHWDFAKTDHVLVSRMRVRTCLVCGMEARRILSGDRGWSIQESRSLSPRFVSRLPACEVDFKP